MKNLYQSSDGKMSGSKTWFAMMAVVVLFKVLFGGVTTEWFTIAEPDYAGLSMILTVFGGAYVARNHKPANKE